MKSALRKWVRRLQNPARSRDELQGFWRAPGDGNRPADYLEGTERSDWLAGVVSELVGPEARIVELGCNVGRNLNSLWERGYRNLAGVEINPEAVALMRTTYRMTPTVHIGAIEDHIRSLRGDLIFTMAVLEHLHPDSGWVFAEMARFPYVVTVEDEREVSERHFPRDYGRVFTRLGKTQTRADLCTQPGIEGFMLRVFN